MKVKDITCALEQFAPLALQEGYDNCGLQVGDPDTECTGALLVVDATPEVVDEALARGCNLIVSHHPLLFKGLKHITGRTRVEQTVINAIAHGIAIYSLHTAIDNTPGGVSHEMARLMEISNGVPLVPMRDRMVKMRVYVPNEQVAALAGALFKAGAGAQGLYDNCSFAVKGTGSFRPLSGARPFVSSGHNIHYESETCIEMMVPSWLRGKMAEVIRRVHPYEQPAYEFVPIENIDTPFGSGIVGDLMSPMMATELIDKVKQTFGTPTVRCNKLPSDPIVKIAMCGGSGSAFIDDAIAAGAEAYITSDTSYHAFVDYTDKIFIIDIGHYESESCTRGIFYRVIKEKFPNFAVEYSKIEKNPIIYL